MNVTRRQVLGVAAVSVPLIGGSASSASAALPVLDMEALVLAAQWDPSKKGTGVTRGAKDAVLLVERALRDRGLLATSLVDGHFGTATIAAYAQWQLELGYRGLDASGLPGKTSLAALGRGRFTLARVLSPGARTTLQGFPINTRTLAMVSAARKRAGGVRWQLTQGGYSPGKDGTSKGTHDGGGVLDVDARPLTSAQRLASVKALREVGFAAWLRRPEQSKDRWITHIHAVAISDTDMSPEARSQIGSYYEGKIALNPNVADDGPKVKKITWEDYQRAH